jgi:hypothetical protein
MLLAKFIAWMFLAGLFIAYFGVGALFLVIAVAVAVEVIFA